MTKTFIAQPALSEPNSSNNPASDPRHRRDAREASGRDESGTLLFDESEHADVMFSDSTVPLERVVQRTNPFPDGAVTGGLSARLASIQTKPRPTDPTVPFVASQFPTALTADLIPATTIAATMPLAPLVADALTGDLPIPPPDLLVSGGESSQPANVRQSLLGTADSATAVIDSGLATIDLNDGVGSRPEQAANRTASLPHETTRDSALTVPLSPSQATVDLGRRTTSFGSSETGQTGALGPIDSLIVTSEPGDDSLVLDLRAAIAVSPVDADLLFKLSVHLHKAGRTESARATLTRLAAVYEARGQRAQAARILGMLGTPSTGPITTEDLPPRPAVRGPQGSGQLTTALAPFDTGRLGLTGALDRGTRTQETRPSVQVAFPSEALSFTDPLPYESDLVGPIKQAIEQSTINLRAGKLAAAFDACLWAIHLDDRYYPAFIRLAEINTALRQRRRARAQAESLVRLLRAEGDERHLWMVYRILLHTSENDLPSLRRLVELLIEAQQTDLASFYAARLIQMLDQEGLTDEAIDYSARLRSLIPGDTRAALEAAILRVKAGDLYGAIEVWEEAVAAGADPIIGKVSISAVIGLSNPDDHWRMLADVGPILRDRLDRSIIDAYARTAAVLPDSSLHRAGLGVFLAVVDEHAARTPLSSVVADRGANSLDKAICAVALSRLAKSNGPPEEFVASVRTSLKFLEDSAIATHSCWGGLMGFSPKRDELGLELGELLLQQGDVAGAVDILKVAKDFAPRNEHVCAALADAFFRTGHLASALTVLDELAAHHRATGKLDAMAAVLRQMSQLAPNNIKVKSRLIDTYLQRGFVAEARAELIQRADLEERSGLLQDAMTSLVRAAELSWSTGLADETFSLYNRVIAMSPNAVEHRHGIVAYYLQLHQTEAAAEHQRAIIDISLREGRRHEAIAALHQVIGLTPDDSSAYYQLGDLLGSVGEYSQAERVYRRILAHQPDDPIAQAKATAMAALKEQRGR